MRYNIMGKNFEIGERTKEKVSAKLERAAKLFPQDTTAMVKVSSHKLLYTVEITIQMAKHMVRAEASAEDMMAAVDKAVDIMENQMVRYKGRMRSRVRRNISPKADYEAITIPEPNEEEENAIVIEKSKHFEVRPMDAEEAVMQMELIGHSFFVFRNPETDVINVVYKRKDGTFGLIEPENK